MVAEGWEVWLAWDIEGTYEEAPPTLVDHLIRDRRWCQGNLQHLWLIFARKLPFPVRMHCSWASWPISAARFGSCSCC